MQDVAQSAGVSAMSVSNVLNGRKVTPATREAVLQAIEQLNYTPNPSARRLASARSISIGLLNGGFSHAFFGTLLVGALNAATRLGAQLLLEQVDFGDPKSGCDAIQALRSRGANAVLLPPVVCEAVATDPRLAEIALPLMGVGVGKPLAAISGVRIDERAAARQITELLISKGRRRIGIIRPPDRLSISNTRYAGYLDALEAHGLREDPDLVVTGALSFEDGLVAAQRLLDLSSPPDGLFACNDELAASALTAAHMRGVRIPQDLAVAGFDDNPLATQVWPPLTTVRQPIAGMSGLALERLVAQVEQGVDNRDAAKTTTHLEFRIVRRASTGD